MSNWLCPTKILEIELSLREAENAIKRVRGVAGGEPDFEKTRVPVVMVAAIRTQSATIEEIIAGYPALKVRMVEFAGIWTAKHPARGQPPRLSDLGARVKSAKRFSLPLPTGKTR